MSKISDPYKTLGLKPGATAAEAKAAYRKLARKWHPDQFQSPQEKQIAEEAIKRINIAYDQLKDPESTGQTSATQPPRGQSQHRNGGTQVHRSHQNKANHRVRAEGFYRQAITLEQAERYQDATKALTQAINLLPDYAEAYHYRAQLYEMRGFEALAAKDRKKVKLLGLEKAYGATPGQEAEDQRRQAKQAAKQETWSNLREELRDRFNRSPAHRPASSQTSSRAGSSPSRGSQAATPASSRPQPSPNPFQIPAVMTAVNQAWRCTARLNSKQGKITQLLPYGSTNGISASTNGRIQLWNFQRGYDFGELKGHSDVVSDLALNADGQLLASSSQDGTIKTWHLSHSELISNFPTGSMSQVIYGPGRHELTCCDAAGEVHRWNSLSAGKMQGTAPPRWASCATYLALSNNRKILLTRRPDNSLHRWLLDQSDIPSQLLRDSEFEQSAIALSPSGRHVAAGDRDGLIRLWNLQTAEPVMAIQGQRGEIKAIAFTPDNRLIATLCSIDDSSIKAKTLVQVWSRPSREQLCEIVCEAGDRFTSLCFSGDSQRLIIGTDSGAIQVWQPS